MRAFISPNKADTASARLLAMALAECGVAVWFDEWELRPGDSITAGIEAGLSSADAFVVFWSKHAASSQWVNMELRASVRNRVEDGTLRIVPILVDDTPLPVLLADYRGFALARCKDLRQIAGEIAGNPRADEIARCLQKRLLELVIEGLPEDHELKSFICPKCGSGNLAGSRIYDQTFDEAYFVVVCNSCGWMEAIDPRR
jgi:RNase P subunit RPR2